jgi:hypothetical protein
MYGREYVTMRSKLMGDGLVTIVYHVSLASKA